MKLSYLWRIAPFVFLAACSSTPDLIEKKLSATPVEKRAYMIGTFAVSCRMFKDECLQSFNSIALGYRAVSDNQSNQSLHTRWAGVFGEDTKHDFVDTSKLERGFHFCVPLPQGQYEFYTFSFYDFAGGGSGYRLDSDKQFKLPFATIEGEVFSVGRLKLATTAGRNVLGGPVSIPDALYVSAESESALAMALKKCPQQAQGKPVRDAGLSANSAGSHPLVKHAK